MINVARDEPAEVVGILSGSAAATLMNQKLDTVDVFENSRPPRIAAACWQDSGLELFCSTFSI